MSTEKTQTEDTERPPLSSAPLPPKDETDSQDEAASTSTATVERNGVSKILDHRIVRVAWGEPRRI